MTEQSPIPEYDWKIRFRKGGKLTVRAAYVQHGERRGNTTSEPPPAPDAPVLLKDADHKIVFIAPAGQVGHVRRGNPVTAQSITVHVRPGMDDKAIFEAVQRESLRYATRQGGKGGV